MAQLDGDVVDLLQSLRAEEVRRVVEGLEYHFVFGRDDGCELCQVTNHEELHPAKRFAMLAETTQHGIDGIEQVRAYHRDFIDNEQVHRSDNLALLLAEVELAFHLGPRHVRREGQLEEGMDGDAACVDGCHASRSDHDRPLA